MRTLLAAGSAAILLAACGASVGPTPPPSVTPAASASAVPSVSPAPDVQRIDILSNGVGAYMLVAIPVAIVHNAAARTTATGVVVHFDVSRGGRKIFALDSPAVMLLAGQTLVIAANCTDTCNSADGVTPTVSVAHWLAAAGSAITAGAASYSCGAGCAGHGYGSVVTTLQGPGLLQNRPVDAFAACTNAAGAIVGGGQRQLTWPQNGGDLAVTIPVILSAQPTTCQASASPPSSTLG